MKRTSVKEVLMAAKYEFNAHKDQGCVIINNFITSNFGYPEAKELQVVKNMANDVIASLRNTRGIYQVCVEESFASVNGITCKIPTCVRLIRKPCKEFLQLNNYLSKYADMVQDLSTTEIKKQYVSGKRNNYDVESEYLLAHNSKQCAAILSWLRSKKATTCNIVLDHKYYEDRSEGYYMESEWTGVFTYSLVISLESKKTGKLKDKMEFFA